ncbi:50S ribosomal protein L19 [Candidatus Sneabacter namystus]|uniref:Large ribosomal subunit protein bL19 n=1 Tax=Candidatus Sneabacter namystus TaxID=2601646 RepID=A0A5C0UIQ3_9RICK|nr:50S ribosomal protein L19 [Candidatus Sneabacter namystus]QEK39630.1 50S ribosomal protein L19 [Candidatus Sneabacter namystus]
MVNILQQIESEQIEKAKAGQKFDKFRVGDTVQVSVRVVDGMVERVQVFAGIVIAIYNKGIAASFLVRRGNGASSVERLFPFYSPLVKDVKVTKRGIVRRAKLYYLRQRVGKASRVKEDFRTNN